MAIKVKVEKLMTRNVASCRADESLAAAARLMWDCDCGALPVVSAEGHVIGMITDRDICMATWMESRPPSAIPVAQAMSREVYTCTPGQSITAAERLMRSRQVRRLPVVDGERRLVGILSLADLVRESERPVGRAHKVVPKEIATTLGEICQPREADASA
jgi:CBS domain-containing protein